MRGLSTPMLISLSWTLGHQALTIDYRALESSMEEQKRWNKEINQAVDRLCSFQQLTGTTVGRKVAR